MMMRRIRGELLYGPDPVTRSYPQPANRLVSTMDRPELLNRESSEMWGVEWAPGTMEVWNTEEEARARRDDPETGDPDAPIVKIVEIRSYYN